MHWPRPKRLLHVATIACEICSNRTMPRRSPCTRVTRALGIAGSFVGGTLASLLGIHFYGWLGNFIVASVGAILVLWLWRAFRDRPA